MNDYKKLLENLLITVERENASDLHLSPGRKPIMRVETELIPLANREALTKEDTVGLLKELVSEEKLAQVMNKQEIDFAYSFHGKLRLRSTAYVQSGRVNLTFRVIQEVREMNELNLPQVLEQFTKKEQGLFLVVGP
ncbi:MAG: twitching motility protein PilT, partial [Candidatus Paceibacteria bacterium]